jgi:hypothetical protein
MDPTALRAVAELARQRAARGSSAAQGDGLVRLGASRTMQQFAIDIEISATELERPTKKRKS